MQQLIAGAACAAIGILITIVVTWSLAAFRPQATTNSMQRFAAAASSRPCWYLRREDAPGMTRLYWSMLPEDRAQPGATAVAPLQRTAPAAPVNPDLIPTWSFIARTDCSQNAITSRFLLIEVGFGWPWTAVSYEYVRFGTSWTDPRSSLRGGIDLGDRQINQGGIGSLPRREVVALPLRPAWAGALGNTVVYGAAAWIMWFGMVMLHRATNLHTRRRRQGLCAACGYDLRGNTSGKCPECSAVIDVPTTL